MNKRASFSCVSSLALLVFNCAAAAAPARLESLVSSPRIDFAAVEPFYKEAVAREGRIDEAVQSLHAMSREAARPKRERANALLAASFLQWKFGLREAAQSSVEAALQIEPGADLALQRARLLEAAGELEAARQGYEQALGLLADPRRREEVRLRMTFLTVNQRNVEALAGLARERDRDFRNRAAVALAVLTHYGEATALYQVYGDDAERFRQHLRLAQWALEAGQAQRAQEHAWEAVRIAALERDRRYALSVLVDAHEADESLDRLLRRLEQKNPLDADERDVQIDLLRRLGRHEDAAVLLGKVDPAGITPAARRQLLRLYAEAGHPERMLAQYRQLIAAEPQQPAWVEGLAQYFLEQDAREPAVHEWRAFIERNTRCAVLLQGAASMARFGFDELAVAAAGKCAAQEPSGAAEAQLFRFELELRRGRTSQAKSVLETLDRVLAPDAADRVDLADGYERLRMPQEALRVLEQLDRSRRGGVGMDERMRMAWLYDSTGQRDKALGVWKALWEGQATEAFRRLVQDRLLSLAAETGALGRLAVELEKKLAEGAASRKDAALLIALYTQANDSASAIEVIEEYFAADGRAAGADIDSLREQATVYRALGRTRAYRAVTLQLLQADPANKVDYLQSLILMQLEDRGPRTPEKDAQLQTWLERLAATGGGAADEEFKAGILVMAGLPGQAIATYRMALARNPQHSDNYLLLADLLRGAQRQDEAIATLQYLVETADQDDAFIVGIDGILNTMARGALTARDRSVLAWAQRRVLERLTARDDKLYLYDLLAELAERTGESGMYFSALENSLAYANSRRSTVLRELIAASAERTAMGTALGAGAGGQPDAARNLRYSRRLVSLGEDLPPEIYIDMGRAFLRKGDAGGARNAFNLALDRTGEAGLLEETGDLFRAEGYARDAALQYQRALIGDAGNVGLARKLAEVRLAQGDAAGAGELYLRALTGVLRGLPERIEAGRGAPPGFESTLTYEYRQHYPQLLLGLLYTAAPGDNSFVRLGQFLDEQLAATAQLAPDGADALVYHPRLNATARTLREMAARNGEYALAEDIGHRLLQLFPADGELAVDLPRQRRLWGVADADAGVAQRPAPSRADAPAAAAPVLDNSDYEQAVSLALRASNKALALKNYRDWLAALLQQTPAAAAGANPRSSAPRTVAALIADARGRLDAENFSHLARYMAQTVSANPQYQRRVLAQSARSGAMNAQSFLLEVEQAAGQPLMSREALRAHLTASAAASTSGPADFDAAYVGARLPAADLVNLFHAVVEENSSMLMLIPPVILSLRATLQQPLNDEQSQRVLDDVRLALRKVKDNRGSPGGLLDPGQAPLRGLHPDNLTLVADIEQALVSAFPGTYGLRAGALVETGRMNEALPLVVEVALARFSGGPTQEAQSSPARSPAGFRGMNQDPVLDYLRALAPRLYPAHQAQLRALAEAQVRTHGLTPAVFALMSAIEEADPAQTPQKRLHWQQEMAQRFPDSEPALAALARTFAALGHVDRHIELLRRLAALAPARTDYGRELFAALRRIDNPIDALASAGPRLAQFVSSPRPAAPERATMGGAQARRLSPDAVRALQRIAALERGGSPGEARLGLLGLLQQLPPAGAARAPGAGAMPVAFSYETLFSLQWPRGGDISPAQSDARRRVSAAPWGEFLDRLAAQPFLPEVLLMHLRTLTPQEIDSQYPLYALLAEAFDRQGMLQARLAALGAKIASGEAGAKERVLWLQLLLKAPATQAAAEAQRMQPYSRSARGYERLLLARVHAHAGDAARAIEQYEGLAQAVLASAGASPLTVLELYEDAARSMNDEDVERLAAALLKRAQPGDQTTAESGVYEQFVLGMLERTPRSAVAQARFLSLMRARGARAAGWSFDAAIRSARMLARQGQHESALDLAAGLLRRGVPGVASDSAGGRNRPSTAAYGAALGVPGETVNPAQRRAMPAYRALFSVETDEWMDAPGWLRFAAARLSAQAQDGAVDREEALQLLTFIAAPMAQFDAPAQLAAVSRDIGRLLTPAENASREIATLVISTLREVDAPIDLQLLRGLIEHQRLDVQLLGPLLQRVAQSAGAADALQLGEMAMRYTQDPGLLRVTRTLALQAGRDALAASIEELESAARQAREAIAYGGRGPAPQDGAPGQSPGA